jgi:hypothetical protein
VDLLTRNCREQTTLPHLNFVIHRMSQEIFLDTIRSRHECTRMDNWHFSLEPVCLALGNEPDCDHCVTRSIWNTRTRNCISAPMWIVPIMPNWRSCTSQLVWTSLVGRPQSECKCHVHDACRHLLSGVKAFRVTGGGARRRPHNIVYTANWRCKQCSLACHSLANDSLLGDYTRTM